ncbi:MAG: hypothetical protein R3261_10380 [Alphaproteobacteria bacterium]|nr:hypothetical protein [Alphaproteobacteria bacterium]
MDWLFLSKIISAVAAVLALTFVAERVSPRAGGLLAGYPLGTAIALFFIGVENGPTFAVDAALYTLPGFLSAMALAYGYFLGLQLNTKFSSLVSVLLSLAFFTCVSFVISKLAMTIWTAIAIPVFGIPIFNYLFKKLQNSKVGRPVAITWSVITIRAVSAATMVVAITGLAALIGPAWSGLLSAFPVSMLPFLVMLHITYGKENALTVIKNYPNGLGALITYTITVYLTYNLIGIYLGTALGFTAASIYLFALATYIKKKENTNAG